MIEMAVERRRSRTALLEMSDEQLKDIGLPIRGLSRSEPALLALSFVMVIFKRRQRLRMRSAFA